MTPHLTLTKTRTGTPNHTPPETPAQAMPDPIGAAGQDRSTPTRSKPRHGHGAKQYTKIRIKVFYPKDTGKGAIAPLKEILASKFVSSVRRATGGAGWVAQTDDDGDDKVLHTTFVGHHIPVDDLDRVLFRINQCQITSLRITVAPTLPHTYERVFTLLDCPSLKTLYLADPLPAATVHVLAAFLRRRSDLLATLIVEAEANADGSTVSVLNQAMQLADIGFIKYDFEMGGTRLHLSLAPLGLLGVATRTNGFIQISPVDGGDSVEVGSVE